jgi:hypothetical protein
MTTIRKRKPIYKKLDGYKTIITVIVLLAVELAKLRGWIDAQTAELLMTLAAGGSILSMRDAIRRKP